MHSVRLVNRCYAVTLHARFVNRVTTPSIENIVIKRVLPLLYKYDLAINGAMPSIVEDVSEQ